MDSYSIKLPLLWLVVVTLEEIFYIHGGTTFCHISLMMYLNDDLFLPLRMNHNNFSDLLTFPLVPSSGQNLNLLISGLTLRAPSWCFGGWRRFGELVFVWGAPRSHDRTPVGEEVW